MKVTDPSQALLSSHNSIALQDFFFFQKCNNIWSADHSGRAVYAWTLFACSNTEILGSNPNQGMDVCIACVYSVFVLFCV
jgi:hypothetical protein